VLLAIAAGAVLVTPDWLTASLEAGEWLPEAPFLAQVPSHLCSIVCSCSPSFTNLFIHLVHHSHIMHSSTLSFNHSCKHICVSSLSFSVCSLTL